MRIRHNARYLELVYASANVRGHRRADKIVRDGKESRHDMLLIFVV